jgi:iron complex transport system substrate-binding protein
VSHPVAPPRVMSFGRRQCLLALAAAALPGCKSDDATATSVTSASASHDAPPRVVSLSPSTTETMFAIDKGALLVGRSQHCDYPPRAAALPSVGGFASPNLESILALRPQVVIGSRSPAGPALEQKLRAHGMETLFPPTDSVDEVLAMITAMGKRFDGKQRADEVQNAIRAELDAVARWAASRPKPRVAMVFDVSPLSVAGPGSFADELISRAGGRNVVSSGGKWPTIDVERLLVSDPDVIIDAMNIGHGDASKLGEAPGWSTLRAVKSDQVRRLRSDMALRPGPRISRGLVDVAFAIHGEEPV